MLRNYLAAAFANLQRNWLYAGITILGLAVSFAAAILIGLYLRDELSFDRFIPDYQRVYRLEATITLPGAPPLKGDYVQSTAAGYLALDFPQIERAARLEVAGVGLRRGDFQALEQIGWADPGFFKIIRLPVAAGDPDAALKSPDGLVLTRSMARKYFGEDAPIGKTLVVSNVNVPPGLSPDDAQKLAAPRSMRVLAVLDDPPSTSHITLRVFGSSRTTLSSLVLEDNHPSPFTINTLVYVKPKPGASATAIEAGLAAFSNRHYPLPSGGASIMKLTLAPLSQLHFAANQAGDGFRPPGDRAVDAGIGAVGLLIVAIAAINFVILMTARATRRAVEVGVRKAVGASRRDLFVQFMGEGLVYVLVGMVLGVSLAELALPYADAFVGRDIRFDYLADPRVPLAIVAGALLTALVAGAYPAMVMSRFRPALALKGGVGQSTGSASVRQALVVVQFAILIGLIVMTATIWRQTSFALHKALRLDTDQVFRIEASCETALKQQIGALPGVKGVACAAGNVVSGGASKIDANRPGHVPITVSAGAIDVGFLELHGLEPLAGRFFDPSRGQDMLLEHGDAPGGALPNVVLNESGALALGFETPRDAVGATIRWSRFQVSPKGVIYPIFAESQVIGVVRDFTLGTVRQRVDPAIYYVDPSRAQFMVVKLSGHEIPETIQAINQVWRSTGHARPLPQEFENQVVQDLYKDVITQGIAIGVCAGLAILIACLGLFALAAFTTERRTKEIGVRKAMGASTFDVVRLLIWQFTRPVLWANLIAWPLAWLVMRRWLEGFAYRVDLPVWLFLAAAAAAVAIAWLTVAIHSWLVARARPVLALRYE